MRSKIMLAATAAVSLSVWAIADTVTLNNGDKITGTIGTVGAKDLKFKSDALGEITIDLANVKNYTFDAPTKVQPVGAPAVTGQVSGDSGNVKVGDKTYASSEVKAVNPAAQAWTGAVVVNGIINRGNTNKVNVGVAADAQLRRDDDVENDRFSLAGAYNYGNSGGGASGAAKVTDTDNWKFKFQYDKFWTDKFYTYGNVKVEHDAVAALEYRVAPGIGLGYQWIETPDAHFSTEAGISYIKDKYDNGDKDDSIAGRLAYHYDRKLNEDVLFFHNLEYLPAFEDPGDYLVTTDAGIRAKLTDDFFAQIRVELKRDSTPAEGTLKNDLTYQVGVGWQF